MAHLDEADRKFLNEIYARAYKKFFAFATDYADILIPCVIGLDSAREQAQAEYEAYCDHMRDTVNASYRGKVDRIESDYEARVARINDDIYKRGLAEGSAGVWLLARALAGKQARIEEAVVAKDLKLAKLDIDCADKIERRAKKIYNEALRNNIAIAESASIMGSRSLNEAQGLGLTAVQAQKLLDEEVYAQYLLFLLKFPYDVALGFVDDDPLFNYNLSASYYDRLVGEMEERGWRE
jgi:hypothetical protein